MGRVRGLRRNLIRYQGWVADFCYTGSAGQGQATIDEGSEKSD